MYISEFDNAMCEYYNKAKAAPFVGQSCLESTNISFSSLMTSFSIIYSVISSLSTLQVRFRTIPIIKSLNLFKNILFELFLGIFLFKAYSNSSIITTKRSFYFIKEATLSIQFSLAVRSNKTVAAGYLI